MKKSLSLMKESIKLLELLCSDKKNFFYYDGFIEHFIYASPFKYRGLRNNHAAPGNPAFSCIR